MNLFGLTDSLATVRDETAVCPHCQASSQVGRGLCLGCLLSVGSGGEEEDLVPEEFDAALAGVAGAATPWRLGNYEILEEIGRGGMGVIYRARQRHSRRIVALKRILSYHADSRETLARFRREAQAAASLDHPHILQIHEVGETEEGVPYFSMKYASGGSLQEVGRALRQNPRKAVNLLAKVARAVEFAHGQGILHRDLKPGNILIDGHGEPQVSDFGLAKWLDASSELTRTLTIFGTPGYIAPEQAEGPGDAKATADVYSLGAILFGLLAHRPPFLGEHALAVIRQAVENSAPRLRSLVPQIDRDLETICARCLEREPTARYHSAGELAEDLERWLAGRSILARPVSPPVKLWRWARRNPVLAGATATALLLTATVIFAQIQRTQLTQKLDAETEARRSVAVLPLLDLDSVVSDAHLSGSLAPTLEKNIREQGRGRVQAVANDSFAATGVSRSDLQASGNNAGTRTVLSGTVRRFNHHLRLAFRLTDTASAETLFQRLIVVEETPRAPGEVAAQLSREIMPFLAVERPGRPAERDPALRNQAANDFIRAGRDLQMRRDTTDLDLALACFEKAVALEPASALARSHFVMTAVLRMSYAGASQELLAKAERFAKEALRLDPTLAETHRALAGLLFRKGDLAGSREQALEAIEFGGPAEGPLLSLAMISHTSGRPDLALRLLQVARQMQMHPADYEGGSADCWTDSGDDRKASQIYERVLALHPELPDGQMGLCRLRLLGGDFAAAQRISHEELERFKDFPSATQMSAQVNFFARDYPAAEKLYRALAEQDSGGGAEFYALMDYRSALGRLRQLRGDKVGGDEILQRCLAEAQEKVRLSPHHPDTLYRLAAVESSLGKKSGGPGSFA